MKARPPCHGPGPAPPSRMRAVCVALALAAVLGCPGVDTFCPTSCTCEDADTRVTCPIASIPRELPVEVTSLRLNNSAGVEVTLQGDDLNSLNNQPNLREIDLAWCNITDIAAEAFMNFAALRSLNLEGNRFVVLRARTFVNLTLRELLLNDNIQLTTLEEGVFAATTIGSLQARRCGLGPLPLGVFKGMENNLTELDLSSNAGNLSLPRGILAGFAFLILNVVNNGFRDLEFLEGVRVVRLDASSNPLGQAGWRALALVPNLADLVLQNTGVTHLNITAQAPSLEILDVTGNHISGFSGEDLTPIRNLYTLLIADNDLRSLPPDLGSYLGNLKVLDASNNAITGLTASTFESMIGLLTLDVENNQIQSLSESLRPALTTIQTSLKLEGNPFHCNCEMRWFWEWYKSLPYGQVNVRFSDCVTPTNRRFFEMRLSEFICTPPVVVFSAGGSMTSRGDVILQCKARGDPAPMLEIYRNEGSELLAVQSPVEAWNKTLFESQLQFILGDFNCTSMSGDYSCEASSLAGVQMDTEYVGSDNCTDIQQTENPPRDITTTPTTPALPGEPPSDPPPTTAPPPEGGQTNEKEKSDAYVIPLIVCLVLILVFAICVAIALYLRRTKQKYDVHAKQQANGDLASVCYNNGATDNHQTATLSNGHAGPGDIEII